MELLLEFVTWVVADELTWGGWAATLPSGRRFDPYRSRWEGVVDAEELDYCRAHTIDLNYDCVQIGWIPATARDEWTDYLSPIDTSACDDSPTLAAHRLLDQTRRAAAKVTSRIENGELTADTARDELHAVIARAMPEFAREHGLALADMCSWALQSHVARAVVTGTTTRPDAPLIGGPSISFRPWTADDDTSYFALLDDPEVWEHLPEPFPTSFSIDTARTLIEVASMSFHHDTEAVLVAGVPVGQCLLRFDQPFLGVRSAEVAYWLGRSHWGKGLMSTILPRFTAQCFERHDVDVIYAWIKTDNRASIRVAERAGYARDTSPLETEVAVSMGRPGFIRYAVHRPR